MEKELPLHIKRAIRRYEKVESDGLYLYPVRVDDHEAFSYAKPALEVLQQSFPVRLMSKPLLAAMYEMSVEGVSEGNTHPDLFYRAILGLALALRLGEGLPPEERVQQFRLWVDRKDPKKLVKVQCTVPGENTVEITPVQYQRLRPIIAAQNGVALYGDEANPDLVQADKDLRELSGMDLLGDVEYLVSAAAIVCQVEEADVYDWPILKLIDRLDSARRVLNYTICGIGASQGTTWKGGNPYPDPWLPRKRKEDNHVELSTFAGGAGKRAVESVEAAR